MRIFSKGWARGLGSTVVLAAIPLLLLASCAQAQDTMTRNIGCANSVVACLDGTATIIISTSKGTSPLRWMAPPPSPVATLLIW